MKVVSRKAFTLVELLVVIAIIAVLISILLPAINKARLAGNSVVCQSNMRQLGIAFANYISEHKRYPNWRWPQAINPYVKGTLLGTTELPEDNLIPSAVIGKVRPLNLVHCPSVPPNRGGQSITLTYSMNGAFVNNAASNFWKTLIIFNTATPPIGDSYPAVKPTKVVKPAEFGLLTEYWHTTSPEQCAWTTTSWRLFVYNNFTMLYTHDKSSNVLFADGHVAPVTAKPTSLDNASGYRKITDQNDSLFNYDYGLTRMGRYTPSKYLN